MKKVTLLATIVMALALSAAAQEMTQPTSGVTFAQVSFTDQMYSHYGQLFIDPSTLYGDGYVNAERYENGQADGWAIRNMRVESGTERLAFSSLFDLGSTDYQGSISAYVAFSPNPLADDSSLRGQTPLTYLLRQAHHLSEAPVLDPNVFEDVVCHKDDGIFWAAQASVGQVSRLIDSKKLTSMDSTGWIIKGKDPKTVLLITASHAFSDAHVQDTSVLFNFQTPECDKGLPNGDWLAKVDQVLERNEKLDYVIVSLKDKPEGKEYPSPLQALYKDIKEKDVITIPQHPGGLAKKGGYYYDVKKKARCYVSKIGGAWDLLGQRFDSNCGAEGGTSGSPVIDSSQTFAIGLVTAKRVAGGKNPVSVKMSVICDDDASDKGKKLLDCKKQ